MAVKKFREGLGLDPQSADPASPFEGQAQFSDGTARTKGLWIYQNSVWVQVGTSSQAPANNKIINGDFYHDRGNSSSVLTSINTARSFGGPERWSVHKLAAGGIDHSFTNEFIANRNSVQTGVDVKADYCGILNPSSLLTGDIVYVSQIIPAEDLEEFHNLSKKISLGCKLHAYNLSSSGTFEAELNVYTLDSINDATNVTLLSSSTTEVVTINNTDTGDIIQLFKEDITATADVSNGLLVELKMDQWSLTDCYIRLMEFQLNEGSSLPEFSLAGGNRTNELLLCNRHLQYISNIAGIASTTLRVIIGQELSQQMWESGTFTFQSFNRSTSAINGGLNVQKPGLYNQTAASFTTVSPTVDFLGFYVTISGYTGLTVGDVYNVALRQNNAVSIMIRSEI